MYIYNEDKWPRNPRQHFENLIVFGHGSETLMEESSGEKRCWKEKPQDGSNMCNMLDESGWFIILYYAVYMFTAVASYMTSFKPQKDCCVHVLLVSYLFLVKGKPHVDDFLSYCPSIY